MKQIWNKTLQNQNFAGNCGSFVFQSAPVEEPEINIPSNPNTNQEVNQLSQNTSYNVSQTIGSWTANRTADVDFGSTNPGRVDGFWPSENNRRLWNIPRQFWIRLFPDRILRNRIVSSLENLNIANQGANGIYTNIQNELHQRSLEATVRYITNPGASLENASLADMDIAENIAKSLDEHSKEKIKSGTKVGNKILKTRGPFKKFFENILFTNWFRKKQFNWINRSNNKRNIRTTKNFMAKAIKAREELEDEVDNIKLNIDVHKISWGNSNAGTPGENNTAKRAWHDFVLAVVNDPNGFLMGGGPVFAGYNFGEICFPDGNINRVRLLDTILLRGFASEAAEAEISTQTGRDMTANLANLNAREIASEADIENLHDIPVERLYERLPDFESTKENSVNTPTDAEIVNDLFWEIIRVERRHNVNFDINIAVFGGQANKMTEVEKISFLLNYIIFPANINRFVKNPGLATPNFAGLDKAKAKKLKAWLHQFREETKETGVGLEETEWNDLKTNAENMITNARTALTKCGEPTFANSFLAPNHGSIPAELRPINNFITNFALFDFETTINKIDDSHKGVFKDFLSKMKVINNTLTEMVSKIKDAVKEEDDRMRTPVGTPPTRPTTRRNLFIEIPLSLPNASLDRLLTNLNDNISTHDYPGGIAGTNVIYDDLRVHLSSKSKVSRETQFREDISKNSTINWYFWENHDTVGRVIPLLQGVRINYVSDSTYQIPDYTVGGAFSASNLTVIGNREDPKTGNYEIIAQDDGGTELYIIEQIKTDNGSNKIIAYRFDVPDGTTPGIPNQQGVNTLKALPSKNNATETIEVHNMAA